MRPWVTWLIGGLAAVLVVWFLFVVVFGAGCSVSGSG
jgi:hypothetical protein